MRTGLYIGKFQPFHNEHLRVCNEMLNQVDHLVILVGSSFKARSFMLPFSFQEISSMINGAINENVTILPILDYIDEDEWYEQVDDIIHKYGIRYIANPRKDKSSDYIDDFIDLEKIDIDASPLSATDIRENWYNYLPIRSDIPSNAWDQLAFLIIGPLFRKLRNQYLINEEYKKQFRDYPYGDPIFNTVDALVRNADGILMIQRKNEPGKDLWAMPGGFLNSDETIKDGILRELEEETSLKLTGIDNVTVIDRPNRSTRFRIITHVGLLYTGKHEVKANDDARDAKWFTYQELNNMSDQIYSDHLEIITHILGEIR